MTIILKEHQFSIEEYLFLESQMEDMDETSPKQAQKSLNHHITAVAAFDGEKIVGIGRLIGDAAFYWCLVDIWVLPEYQGKGIGRKIVQWLLQYIKENSLKNTRVSVFLMAAFGKEGFYEKLGFRTRPHEYEGAGMKFELDM
ncbi:MAG: GNAT family N-acetyltransferase [Streptococcaceae bacterium]|nr:GNAT family N-acetyltransferase [Streptococcaceae bacterium]